MFPYPSGQLHMGHVRVYAISDAMARFYRMCGHRVLHPMGWDAFGLPAENAARQRGIAAADWTRANIAEMRAQLQRLGCSFDWAREVCTSEPEYYRWTQWLFLRLYDEGMVYQAEALVNWDPVDETVLADEQVDANGCSWRSGARVEKKLLRQWFVRTTRFAQRLLDGLNDEGLQDWRDIIKLQRHWIGECDGYRFEMPLEYDDGTNNDDATLRLRSISLWTRRPEELLHATFVAISPDHLLSKLDGNDASSVGNGRILRNICVRNPFDDRQRSLPVVVVADSSKADGEEETKECIAFDEGCDTYLGVATCRNVDRALAIDLGIECGDPNIDKLAADESVRETILREAQLRNIGGWPVSSKLKDWPISRQRAWGTPIPIVHCDRCGAVPVPDAQLPVLLAEHSQCEENNKDSTTMPCPKCQTPDCRRESDTMDTFVDSSWYFLRFMDPNNSEAPFSRSAANRMAPVDLYVGGKEHAVLHLYYARFMSHFLHSIGCVPLAEPFRRLLVQGMVMGRSYRVKGSGRYLRADEVRIVDAKKNQARTLVGDGEPVVMQWEKMSKSKLNGADPTEAFDEHGTDSIRLIMLGDVAPTSHRNWSETSE